MSISFLFRLESASVSVCAALTAPLCSHRAVWQEARMSREVSWKTLTGFGQCVVLLLRHRPKRIEVEGSETFTDPPSGPNLHPHLGPRCWWSWWASWKFKASTHLGLWRPTLCNRWVPVPGCLSSIALLKQAQSGGGGRRGGGWGWSSGSDVNLMSSTEKIFTFHASWQWETGRRRVEDFFPLPPSFLFLVFGEIFFAISLRGMKLI